MTGENEQDAQAGECLGHALAWATASLAESGVAAPRLDARLLLAAAAGLVPEQVFAYPERRLDRASAARFADMLDRRRAREPVSRILGRREFWSLDFTVAPETLDPRPESETLVEAMLQRMKGPARPLRVLDLGTGSGCLLLALLSELPEAWGLGLDVDPGALGTARQNAEALGLGERARFAAADWGAPLAGRWDVIVCNPPYIETAAIEGLAPEVARYDPWRALDGGTDGLAAYRRIAPQLTRLLAPSGLAGLEVGAGQADAVRRILQDQSLHVLGTPRDLTGVERCILVCIVSPEFQPLR